MKLKKQLDYTRRYGYTLEDMVKGIWLSDWSLNIVPRFTFLRQGSDSMVELVKEAIREALEAIDIKLPRNFDALVEDGYKLVKELDELLKKNSKKILSV